MVWSVAITTMRLSYRWHGCCAACQWEIGAQPSCRALKHRLWQNGKMTKSSIQGQNLAADEWGRTACCLSLPPWELSRRQLDVWHDVTPICSTKIERLADVFFMGNLCTSNCQLGCSADWKHERRSATSQSYITNRKAVIITVCCWLRLSGTCLSSTFI